MHIVVLKSKYLLLSMILAFLANFLSNIWALNDKFQWYQTTHYMHAFIRPSKFLTREDFF